MNKTDNHSQFRLWTRLLLAGALLALPSRARADYKSFAHVYPYFTQPQGGLELEIWTSFETADLRHAGQSTFIQQFFELEYGISDHWDVSLYWVLAQPAGQPLSIESYRLESRYRFAEKGLWPVDTEIYGEVERPANLRDPFELEGKVILGKGLGRLFLQGNLVGEFKIVGGAAFGYRLAFEGGVGYEITPGFKLGIEALLNHQRPLQDSPVSDTVHLGPSLALATSRIWFVVTPAFRVAGSSTVPDVGNDLRLRIAIGVPLD
jgi:hypothetical protein